MAEAEDTTQDPPTASIAPKKTVVVALPRPGRRALLGVGGALLLLACAVGGFLLGQGTRKSDEQVATETKSTVSRAVTQAVEAKGADDKQRRLRIMHREATRINARHRVEIRKLGRSATRRASQAYSSGSVVGRQEGYSSGVDDGVSKATDEVTCSDDSDVPLPYCN